MFLFTLHLNKYSVYVLNNLFLKDNFITHTLSQTLLVIMFLVEHNSCLPTLHIHRAIRKTGQFYLFYVGIVSTVYSIVVYYTTILYYIK